MYANTLGSPQTFAQYSALHLRTHDAFGKWYSTLSPSARLAQYRTYVAAYWNGQYGGPQPGSVQPGTIMRVSPPPGEAGGSPYGPGGEAMPYSPGTYQGTGPGSSPSTMTPTDTGAAPLQSAIAGTPSLGPLVLFGGIGVIAFLYFRGKKAKENSRP